MPLTNTPTRFGTVSRFLHWSVFLLFVHQFVGGNLMPNIGRNETVLGWSQGTWYEWHKSIGLVILALMCMRLAWRSFVPMPDWAACLSGSERRITRWIERLLYTSLLLLPLTGYLFVMAGDFNIKLFDHWRLPNPIGKQPALASVAHLLHVILTYVAVVAFSWHIGLVLKKHHGDGAQMLQRMVPFTAPPDDEAAPGAKGAGEPKTDG